MPVVLTLGTKFVIQDDPKFWQEFLRDHVTVVAMNEDEALALTGESDPLAASDKALDWVDLVLCTAGPVGLFMAGYTEDSAKRETSLPLLPGSVPEFNRYEFSRPARKESCINPIRVYSHISPYMGGPEKIKIPMVLETQHYQLCCMIWQLINTIKKTSLTQVSINMSF